MEVLILLWWKGFFKPFTDPLFYGEERIRPQTFEVLCALTLWRTELVLALSILQH